MAPAFNIVFNLFLVTSTAGSPYGKRHANQQCYVNETIYEDDRLDNPVFDGEGYYDLLTLDDCMAKCNIQYDLYGRPCEAVEWSDFGNAQPNNSMKLCALAWGCDYTVYWFGGSVFKRNMSADPKLSAHDPTD